MRVRLDIEYLSRGDAPLYDSHWVSDIDLSDDMIGYTVDSIRYDFEERGYLVLRIRRGDNFETIWQAKGQD